jgi:hypothetical protein
MLIKRDDLYSSLFTIVMRDEINCLYKYKEVTEVIMNRKQTISEQITG